MSAFFFDDDYKFKIKKLKEYAESHPFSTDDMLDRINGRLPAPVDTVGFWCALQGIKIIFTIEQFGDKTYRHLSISDHRPGKFPHPVLCQHIMEDFGFQHKLNGPAAPTKCQIIIEKGIAINIAEIIE